MSSTDWSTKALSCSASALTAMRRRMRFLLSVRTRYANMNLSVCRRSEGGAVLVRHGWSRFLSESAAGGEDGSVGQVFTNSMRVCACVCVCVVCVRQISR